MAENTPFAVILALIAVAVLAWRLKPSRFRALRRSSFALASALFWGAFSAVLFSVFWSSYYSYFAPPWQSAAGPFIAAALYALIALLFRWLSLRLPGNPVITFCLLGGLESLPEHAIAINRFRILDIPILQGSSPGSIMLFAFFEYIVYWGIVIALASLVDCLLRRLAATPTQPPAPRAASA